MNGSFIYLIGIYIIFFNGTFCFRFCDETQYFVFDFLFFVIFVIIVDINLLTIWNKKMTFKHFIFHSSICSLGTIIPFTHCANKLFQP